MSIQVTEIELEHTASDGFVKEVTISKLGKRLTIRDNYSDVTISVEMIDDFIKALNIFKGGY